VKNLLAQRRVPGVVFRRAYGGAGASLAQLQQAIAAIAWGEPATALIVCMQ
jgi:alkylation response protein AidB-like acyl-CoA dehydrogenase